ncbi:MULTISPECIES: phage recombination protein Bet [Streptomyces]|uniref:RecT family protein n=1 Tax=Streptomyces fradiae ATCC 10745 = DSM 40063 TaxID=1319510 RepID=A0A1Y2NTQ9_STRFR|nr:MULTISPECIES: phage recombination protein Bet [Streptomyces]KAF0647126.1 hypothetical protein K701_25390 [Streptomyces fradiae ATCC 10745 = DSM 40063]OSY50449.1 RecT family protein [Streptomyces fradiae ATCC 10745 = DSM 40063]QEV12055.1 phage recombination protein Bet [Streptomyces fradiae ATCC 10745 = DSM 40063]
MSTDLVQTGGALAIRPDQTQWTEQQATVLRQSGIGDTVTRAELDGFLHLCQRTGLDPFSRQIYLIGRWDKRAGREVYTPQTGIDGYRVVARRAVAKSGGSYGYEDTLWCDPSGRWRDVWLADEPPAAAKVTVLRDGLRFSAVALYREYVQTNRDGKPIGLWAKMPAGQLGKCAEALALRKAFPHDLAGVYTTEEMGQADNPSAEGRHLRRVQPGEADPWATQPARDFLAEAEAAPDADTVRRIWQDAKQAGMPAPTLNGIVEVGRMKAAVEDVTDAAGEAGWQQEPARQAAAEVVDGEVVEDEHTTAVAELRQFAAEHRITDIDADAYTALGAPLDDVSPDAIRALLAQLRASTAA